MDELRRTHGLALIKQSGSLGLLGFSKWTYMVENRAVTVWPSRCLWWACPRSPKHREARGGD